MTALAVFLALTAVLTALLRLRAHLRPQPYDPPLWWWRITLTWRAYRGAHGHHPHGHTVLRHDGPRTGRPHPTRDTARGRNPDRTLTGTASGRGSTRPHIGRRVLQLDLTDTEQAATGEHR